MNDYEYTYNICTVPDKTLFYKQCAALEKHIPNLKKLDFLHDVDDSLIQLYEKDGQSIKVCNCEYIGALYVDSEFDLKPFFN